MISPDPVMLQAISLTILGVSLLFAWFQLWRLRMRLDNQETRITWLMEKQSEERQSTISEHKSPEERITR